MKMIKSGRLRWESHAAAGDQNAFKILIGKIHIMELHG